jgi:hypothetical protein
VDLNVAEWGGFPRVMSIGQEPIPSGSDGYGSGGGYADFNTIDSWTHTNHPGAYIQFQTAGGTLTQAREDGIIANAERYWGRSVEWYEDSQILNPPSVSDMTAYQTWVNNTFG